MNFMTELYIGLMSGTSMDAVDAVLVDFSDHAPHLMTTHSNPLPDNLRKELIALCTPSHDEINRCGAADVRVGKLFAETIKQLLAKANIAKKEIRAIGSHGQTIRHMPNGKYPFTLQIGDPNVIAQETGITTIADFRRRDIAAGGQGAPLAPAFHNYIFHNAQEERIVLNLGGIANITWLPKDIHLPVIGFDTGPANTLLDAWINKNLQKNFDENGEWAASGKVNLELLNLLLSDPYFQRPHPKSTGREYFNLVWLTNILEKYKKNILPQDIQTTLCELTAQSILQAITSLPLTAGKILVCGGGIKNTYLIQRLKHHANNFTIHSTEEFGVPPQWMEAMAFAWLAKQTLEKKAGNLPSVTGARELVVLGGIYY
jgi:anhydro-N-acetylmuramic acid kinase